MMSFFGFFFFFLVVFVLVDVCGAEAVPPSCSTDNVTVSLSTLDSGIKELQWVGKGYSTVTAVTQLGRLCKEPNRDERRKRKKKRKKRKAFDLTAVVKT